MEPSLDAAEDVVAGEHHALFLDGDCRLVEGVAGHVNHLERVVTHVHRHPVLEGYDRIIELVTLQQRWFFRTEGCDPGDMVGQVGVEHASPHPLVGDDRHVEESVPRPMVAVGLGVDDVLKLPLAGDLSL